MDPRAALFQEESDDSSRFRNRSIGMHNLRDKLREQLKGYSHIRGFPLGPDPNEKEKPDSRRNDSLTVRRDSIRRRNSSVTRQERYQPDEDESKYKLRRPVRRQQESLLVPRLLWAGIYIALVFGTWQVYKLLAAEPQVKLCQQCDSKCGVLNEDFTIPIDNLGGLPFGTVFPHKSATECRAGLCVPGNVANPTALCKVVSDEALLYRTRRLLQDEESEKPATQRFIEYFRRRAMREEGLAQSPDGFNPPPSTVPPPTSFNERTTQTTPPTPDGFRGPPPGQGSSPPSQGTPPPSGQGSPPPGSATPPPGTAPPPYQGPPPGQAPAPGPTAVGDLTNGGYLIRRNLLIDANTVPGLLTGGGNCSTLLYAPEGPNKATGFDQPGYANITTDYYKVYSNVLNYQQCCSICSNEPDCVAWTRVAGGDSSVTYCFIKNTLNPEPNAAALTYNFQPDMPIYPPNPEVRYAYNPGVTIMLESGTRNWNSLPDRMYGCPYPPVPSGLCVTPAGCNCFGSNCYPSCLAPDLRTVVPGQENQIKGGSAPANAPAQTVSMAGAGTVGADGPIAAAMPPVSGDGATTV